MRLNSFKEIPNTLAEIPTNGLVFYADLRRHDGTSFMSDDAYGHLCTVTGATWGSQGRTYTSGQYITAPTTALNFTASDFTLLGWIKSTNLSDGGSLLTRGSYTVDGWFWRLQADGSIWFDTSQGGAEQGTYSAVGSHVIDTWYFVGVTRAGAVAKIYRNALDITTISGNHINPATCARTLKIGIYEDLSSTKFVGVQGGFWVYSRKLSIQELTQIFNATRSRYGV